MNTIYKRQSVRKYKNQEVNERELLEIAKAALVAPSSKNKQPWEVLVINDEEVCSEMAKVHSNWKMLDGVKSCIIVCGNLEKDERTPHMLMACSAAIQNILLQATEYGVGSVWLGCYPDDVRMNWLKEHFQLPEKVEPVAVIALGYAEQEKERKDFGDLTKLHLGKW